MRTTRTVALLVLAMGATAHGGTLPAQSDSALVASIPWQDGPVVGRLGSEAEIRVPGSCRFTGAKGTKTVLTVSHNPVSGGELGTVLCEEPGADDATWFVVFSYDESGHVRDDEGASLDSSAILASIRRGTAEANKERSRRGWETLTIEGWVRPPYYDPRTHNLTWSLRAVDSKQEEVINHSVRLLGREGVMHADLIIDPSQLSTAVPAFDTLIAGFHYLPGRTYAAWRKGDKLAAFGLTALVAGGAGAVAMKTGLLAKAWKLIVAAVAAVWKLLAAAAAAVGAWFKSLFRRRKRAGESKSASSP